MDDAWTLSVERLCRQYFQQEPVLDLPSNDHLRLLEVQDSIFKNLFAAEDTLLHPPQRYKVKSLKRVMSRVEAAIMNCEQQEISNDLMNTLSMLFRTPLPAEAESAQQKHPVTYHISSLPTGHEMDLGHKDRHIPATHEPKRITLFENRSLISASGTTGLRTWEASLHLGQYLCKYPRIVSGRRVLELGAGTAYLSLLCAKHLHSAEVIASDGSDDVLDNIALNLRTNSISEPAAVVRPMRLDWGKPLVETGELQSSGDPPIDVVLGADLTYERGTILALVRTLWDLLTIWPLLDVYIAATQRNEETFKIFRHTCQENRLAIEELHFPVLSRREQNGPFYSDQLAIRICKITQATTAGQSEAVSCPCTVLQ